MTRLVRSISIALGLSACIPAPIYVLPGTPDPRVVRSAPAVIHPVDDPSITVLPRGCVATYSGVHPVPYEYGGGWCEYDGLHCHGYLPNHVDQFVYRNRVYVFGADVDFFFGYGHPIPPAFGGGWCDVPGDHRHRYRPTVDFFYEPGRRVYVYRPTPQRPGAVHPVPSQPAPVQPVPQRPGAVHPVPSQPAPVQPVPQRPGAVNPVPSRPTPVQPAPQRIPYGEDVRPVVIEPAPLPARGTADVQRPGQPPVQIISPVPVDHEPEVYRPGPGWNGDGDRRVEPGEPSPGPSQERERFDRRDPDERGFVRPGAPEPRAPEVNDERPSRPARPEPVDVRVPRPVSPSAPRPAPDADEELARPRVRDEEGFRRPNPQPSPGEPVGRPNVPEKVRERPFPPRPSDPVERTREGVVRQPSGSVAPSPKVQKKVQSQGSR